VKETVFRLTVLNENLHDNYNDNDGHIQKFNYEVHNIFMLGHLLIYDDGKTHSHVYRILIGRGWHSSTGLLDESSLRGADCDIGHYPMAAVFGWIHKIKVDT
jgi:hypothetical protein